MSEIIQAVIFGMIVVYGIYGLVYLVVFAIASTVEKFRRGKK